MMESLLRDTTIKAIDGVAKKLVSAEAEAETKVARLLAYWNEMEQSEKEHAVGIAIATITTVVTAIMAMRRKATAPAKKVRRIVKKK